MISWNKETTVNTLAKTVTYTLNYGMKCERQQVSSTIQLVMTYTGNTRKVCPGNQKETFEKSGWEKHDRDQLKPGKLRHWGLKVLLGSVRIQWAVWHPLLWSQCVSCWAIIASSGQLVALSVCHLFSAKPLSLLRKCAGTAFSPQLTNFKASWWASFSTYQVADHSWTSTM